MWSNELNGLGNPLTTLPLLTHSSSIEDLRPEESLSGAFVSPRSPLAWFLPGRVRMRGGAARRFASGRHFHRGIQAESTSPGPTGIFKHYQ